MLLEHRFFFVFPKGFLRFLDLGSATGEVKSSKLEDFHLEHLAEEHRS